MFRVAERVWSTVPLPPEQAAQVGLDPAVDYCVEGLIYDTATRNIQRRTFPARATRVEIDLRSTITLVMWQIGCGTASRCRVRS